MLGYLSYSYSQHENVSDGGAGSLAIGDYPSSRTLIADFLAQEGCFAV